MANNIHNDPSCVAAYFGNRSLTQDYSGKGNHLTNVGVTWDNGAKFIRAEGDYLYRPAASLSEGFPGTPGYTDLALYCEFTLASLPDVNLSYFMLAKRDVAANQQSWDIRYKAAADGSYNLLFDLGYNSGASYEIKSLHTGTLSVGTRYGIAFYFDDSTKGYYGKLYNITAGTVVAETSTGLTTTNNMSPTDAAFTLGCYLNIGVANDFFDGTIHKLYVFNAPKTEADFDAMAAGTYGADYIGNVPLPYEEPSGEFPIIPDYPYGMSHEFPIAEHQFGSANAKITQRFLLGNGARRFTIYKSQMRESDRIALRNFWENQYGPYGAFIYKAPNDDGSGTTPILCRFANEPLSWEFLSDVISSVGITLIEIPVTSPSYALNQTVLRFPSEALKTALLSQVQKLIPLVRIQPRQPGYPAIHISDRRCTIGSQLYLPRLLEFSGISQGMSGESDQAQFTFGNADRVMRNLVNDVDLIRASLEFSLFHIGTGIKLDLWKGEIVDWSMDTGPEFHITAADGMYELTLPYPTRKISRSCWKCFNDTVSCPFATQSTGMDYGHFPNASPADCDKGYDTPNGCLAHGMKRYFGGVIAQPQSVRIKDNSTGVFGYGRSKFTSTSIVSESIYDQVVPEIYTDNEAYVDENGQYKVGMPVNCKIAAGREESDFYAALGIVGEGPLEFTIGNRTKTIKLFGHEISYTIPNTPMQLLDGQHNHGYPGISGLRYGPGTDPAGPQDWFSIGRVGSNPQNWREATDGTSVWQDNFSAGLAFLEIKRKDEKGIQLSYPSEHTMEANILNGMQGWVWTAPGTRSQKVLTNPVWIAVNMLLRARGLRFADEAACEQYFDVNAAIAAAAVCDDTVDALIGGGEETQFKFRGVVQEEKPLRDWIQEILMNCLGYYTFAFGKLKLGVRVNSSVVEAFTEGNILFQSLQLAPLKPSFNHLTANFADREFNFAANSVCIYDIDHARLIGGSTAPQFLKANVNLSGTCSKSQAARIITTRLREELGGITPAQWKAARRLSFKTTVLALNTEPGMVCSMTHPDMPDGEINGLPAPHYGEFRVTGWKLNGDYSIDIEGQTTVDEMYNLVDGPKPAAVIASPVPTERVQRTFGLAWHPDMEIPISGDPIYAPGEKTFALSQHLEQAADDTSQLQLVISGRLPVNDFSSDGQPKIGSCTSTATGGTIEGNRDYFFALCARDANGKFSLPSNVVAVRPAAGSTNAVSLSDITWPAGTYAGYDLFGAADHQQAMCHLATFTGTLPTSISVTAPLSRNTYSMPNPIFRHLRLKAKKIAYVGVARITVTGVSANTITSSNAIGADDWTGRDLMLVYRKGSDNVPLRNFHCTAFSSSTGAFTVSPNPVAAGIGVGDILAILAMPPTECGSTSISAAKFITGTHPAGITVDAMIGNLVRIIAGTGRGQVRRVSDNTATVLTIDSPWEICPDETSRFIIEHPTWEHFAETNYTKNADRSLVAELAVTVANQMDCDFLVQVCAVDTAGMESPDELSPVRICYVNPITGNPSGASGLEILTRRHDPTIPPFGLSFSFLPDNDNGAPIEGVSVVLSPGLPAHGPCQIEREKYLEKIYESGTCRVTKGSREVAVTRSASDLVVGKVFLIYSDDVSPDSDLDGNIVESEGVNRICLTRPFAKSGTFRYVIIEPWWPPNDTPNILFQYFPIEDIVALAKNGTKLAVNGWADAGGRWRTPTILAPAGRYYATVISRNRYGLGTRIVSSDPITVTYDGTVTDDTDNPSGCSNLQILTHEDDATIPRGCMAFRFNRDSQNYHSIFAVEIAMGIDPPLCGPYPSQIAAHPELVLASGTGMIVRAGNVFINYGISSPPPGSLNGKVLLIIDEDKTFDGNIIKTHAAEYLELTKAFYFSNPKDENGDPIPFDWVVLEPWWPLNPWERTFWVPQDFQISDVEEPVWQTIPVPLFEGENLYAEAYSKNIWGVSI